MNANVTNPNAAADAPSRRSSRGLDRLRRVLLTVTALGVVIVLVYGVENVRGWRTWSKERDRLLAAGRKVTIEEFIPPPVAEERNFAMIPVFRPLLDFDPNASGTDRWRDPEGRKRALAMMAFEKVHGGRAPQAGTADSARARATDLEAWQKYFRTPGTGPEAEMPADLARRYGLVPITPVSTEAAAPIPKGYPLPAQPGSPATDVLAALDVFESDFRAIHEGLMRPESRFPLRYEDGYSTLLPHLAVLNRLTIGFTLRASARLAAGDSEGALSDTLDAVGLGEALASEPFQISQWSRTTHLNRALGVIWEGQVRHAWTEDHLAALQSRLALIETAPAMRLALGMERAMALRLIERLSSSFAERRRHAELSDDLFVSSEASRREMPMVPFLLFAPRGWLYANAAATAQVFEELESASASDLPGLRAGWDPLAGRDPIRLVLHRRFFVGEHGSKQWENLVRAVACDHRIRLGMTACALERYRLRHREYPDQLEALVPGLLSVVPRDEVAERPVRYQREAHGTFRLWAVGEDGRDDSGVQSHRLEESGRAVAVDWLWRWPEPEETPRP